MSKIEVNAIEPQCGTTLTVGASGDTVDLSNASVTFPSGTGTVNWDTAAKTASFTAVSGNGYFVNTTSGAITVTLPASPSAGAIVSIADYTNTFSTNNVTVGRNSQPIGGIASDAILNTDGLSVTFVYVDSTEGWKNVQDATSNITGNPNIVATGGTITTCGDFKIHTFTGPGTFCVSNAGQGTPTAPSTVDYLVIAGGGGGGGLGGGGAGGYRESSGNSGCYTASPLATPTGITITATAYPITAGGGGAGGPGSGTAGSNSIFSTITSAGGGAGGTTQSNGGTGGSGAGGGGSDGGSGTGGAGNTPPVSPPQGNSGGSAGSTPGERFRGGGGGGATASGTNAPADGTGGPGGAGATTSINGTPTARAGGGGGGTYYFGGTGTVGTGGSGGGGTGGGPGGNCSSTDGTTNTGGGGGGRGLTPAGSGAGSSGSGGSGIVIIRYKFQ